VRNSRLGLFILIVAIPLNFPRKLKKAGLYFSLCRLLFGHLDRQIDLD
jgi:hypothetical protein